MLEKHYEDSCVSKLNEYEKTGLLYYLLGYSIGDSKLADILEEKAKEIISMRK